MLSDWPGRKVAKGSPPCTRLTSCELLWGKGIVPELSGHLNLAWYWEFLGAGNVEFCLSAPTGSLVMACSCSVAGRWRLITQTSHLTAWLWTTPPCRWPRIKWHGSLFGKVSDCCYIYIIHPLLGLSLFLAGVQPPAVWCDADAQSVRERGEQCVCRPGGRAWPRAWGQLRPWLRCLWNGECLSIHGWWDTCWHITELRSRKRIKVRE